MHALGNQRYWSRVMVPARNQRNGAGWHSSMRMRAGRRTPRAWALELSGPTQAGALTSCSKAQASGITCSPSQNRSLQSQDVRIGSHFARQQY
eukprot:scaffold148868_cov31-Tisochrysis_lutea.AAC.2